MAFRNCYNCWSNYYIPNGTLIEKWISSCHGPGRISKTYGLKADGTPLGDGKYEYDAEGRESRICPLDEFDPKQPISIRISSRRPTNPETGSTVEISIKPRATRSGT